MANDTEQTLNALRFYFKKKQINQNSGDAKKLTGFLKAGKNTKFQNRRKRWFPDYGAVIKAAANDSKKEIDTKIKTFGQLAKDTDLTCTRITKSLQLKSTSFQKAITALDQHLTDTELKLKAAKDRVKVLEKITKALGPGTKPAKALAKINPLKEKAEKALLLIQSNLTSCKGHQKRLKANHQKIQTTSEQNASWQEKLSAAKLSLEGHRAELKTLRQSKDEAVLASELSKTLDADTALKALKALHTNANKALAAISDIDTSYSGGKIIARNETEWHKILDIISLANAYWIASSATKELTFYDTGLFYAYFDGTRIYPSSNPKVLGVAQDPFLKSDLNTGYTLLKIKGNMVKVKDIGWCKFDDLYSQKERDRVVYLDQYKKWLLEQYEVMDKLKGQEKLDRIRGTLSQAQTVINQFNRGKPMAIDSLEKAPVFKENPQKVNSPHELIQPLRKWIERTEKNIRNVDKETNANENAGSLYSDIDWNTLLKVPQYRTQSDNLISPEATCAPTTFTMMAERAGWSRADLIKAIEKRFKDQGLPTTVNTWKSKGKAFLNWVNKKATGGEYQKVRAGKIKKDKFEELAKNFKSFAQYEDLTFFYHYLINSANKTSINSNEAFNTKLRQGIENEGNFKKEGSYRFKLRRGFSTDLEMRQFVKNQLDKGSVVMFSIFHKGAGSIGTHNYFVQSINQEGYLIDDPYGLGNKDYRRKKGVKFDLYAVEGQASARDRKKHDFKNKPDIKAQNVKLENKDFTLQAAQRLTSDESRGESSMLTWEMMTRSDRRIINYIVVWEKNKRGV